MTEKKVKLTFLTEPVSFVDRIWTRVNILRGRRGKYGGHPARTKRIIEGLEKIGYKDFNYQPRRISDIGEYVHVFSNVRTLKFAIKLKEEGKISKLTAGPNIVVFSNEYDSIIANPAIDLYFQPSPWAVHIHEKIEPKLKGRCVSYPYGGVGIDLEQYKPNKGDVKGKVLLYFKLESEQLLYNVRHILVEKGYEVDILFYGKYVLSEYIDALNACEFMVTVGRQEASGNYLTEAWAMDTPTICYDPRFYHWSEPYEYDAEGEISTCPYLSEETGTRFSDVRQLQEILDNIKNYQVAWHPRKWISEHMTDKQLSYEFLKLLGIHLDEQ